MTKMGRPTVYKPDFCARVVELGKLGKSKAQIGAELGVARSTIDEWMKTDADFSAAIACARDFAMAWWEEQGQTGMWQSDTGEKLNPQLWSRSMAARFPDDYRESSKVEHAGSLTLTELIAQSMKPAYADGPNDGEVR